MLATSLLSCGTAPTSEALDGDVRDDEQAGGIATVGNASVSIRAARDLFVLRSTSGAVSGELEVVVRNTGVGPVYLARCTSSSVWFALVPAHTEDAQPAFSPACPSILLAPYEIAPGVERRVSLPVSASLRDERPRFVPTAPSAAYQIVLSVSSRVDGGALLPSRDRTTGPVRVELRGEID